MRKGKPKVYLTELCHNGFGLSILTFPLGLGVVASYVKKQFPTEIDLRIFRTHDDLISMIKREPPDIIGFGYFTWNDYITLVAARTIRKYCPDVLIVFGGPNISPYGQEKTSGFFLSESDKKNSFGFQKPNKTFHGFVYPVYDDYQLLTYYPEIDVIIHGDAEVPLMDIIKKFLETGDRKAVKNAAIAGCSSIVDQKIIRGSKPETLWDLDVIPSPYASGIFNDFMDRFKMLPQIETLRGCPYLCTFCTIGLNEGRMRKHSFEYTKEEILYLKERYPYRALRIADPNWGMAAKDVKLAEYLHDLHEKEGYPSSLRVYYSAGGPFKNIQRIAFLMRELLPLNMSFQSLNEETLTAIKRGNMPLNKVQEMVSFAREHKIATSTELISGLPKETYEIFRENFLKAIELRIDSVYMNTLYLIKGSELYTPAARSENAFKTAFSLIETDVTKIEGRWTFEMDEMVVGSSHISREDFFKLHRFKMWAWMVYAAGFLKEIIMHGLNYDVNPIEIYDELMGHDPDYPFINKITDQFVRDIEPLFFETPQDLEKTLTEHIKKYNNVELFTYKRHSWNALAKVLGRENKVIFVDEMALAMKNIFQKKMESRLSKDESENFYEALEALRIFQPKCIITPLSKLEKKISVSFPYDLIAWARDNYGSRLPFYKLSKPAIFSLNVRNPAEHDAFHERTRGVSEAERYDYYYKVMVSSNMRRLVEYACPPPDTMENIVSSVNVG